MMRLLNCFGVSFSVSIINQATPGSRSPGRVPIGIPAAGVNPMLVSMLLTVTHGGQAGTIAEVSEDYSSLSGFRACDTSEFFHEIGIGKSMKTVSLYPHCLKAARDRQDLGHTRHVAVKCRVKAGHLRQFGMTTDERPRSVQPREADDPDRTD